MWPRAFVYSSLTRLKTHAYDTLGRQTLTTGTLNIQCPPSPHSDSVEIDCDEDTDRGIAYSTDQEAGGKEKPCGRRSGAPLKQTNGFELHRVFYPEKFPIISTHEEYPQVQPSTQGSPEAVWARGDNKPHVSDGPYVDGAGGTNIRRYYSRSAARPEGTARGRGYQLDIRSAFRHRCHDRAVLLASRIVGGEPLIRLR